MSFEAVGLAPEDLGLTVEEDSSDVTDEEIAAAIETEDIQDFTSKCGEFVRLQGALPSYTLRRKGGILYCRVSVNKVQRTFQIEWLRRG